MASGHAAVSYTHLADALRVADEADEVRRDGDLLGMKWSSSYALCEEVAGKSSWRTGEEYGGEQVTITRCV